MDHVNALKGNPKWHDVESAAWWCWGLCLWIGSGWCAVPKTQRVATGNAGRGIHRATAPRQRVATSDAGRGSSGCGLDATHQRHVIESWITILSERMRRVRVLCGDWSQAVQRGVMQWASVKAVYFDPPYAHRAKRDTGLYGDTESATVADDVRAWCAENGDNPRLRIALAGYEGEHEHLESLGWSVEAWKPHGHGYAAQASKAEQGKANVKRERVWYSPHCPPRVEQGAQGLLL